MGDPQQQFCLRWNNHGSTLVSVFDHLLTNESLVDVTLFAEGRLLRAHKVVLSACSPYFQTLFAQTKDKHPIVILKDVKYLELKALLDYMYRGEVNIAQSDLGPLIDTADSLKIKGLAEGYTNAKTEMERDARSSHPAGLDLAKHEECRPEEKHSGRQGRNNFPIPQASVPSVLSTVLTMPPALSLASSTLVPPIKIPSLNPSTGTPTDGSSHEDIDSPHVKQRRKRMRRKSNETGESGDSDQRSSGSPVETIHLPRIPATITPVGPLHHHHHHHHHNSHREQQQHQQQQHQQHKERERELERELERAREQEREWERERERDSEREQERERERERDFQEQFRATRSPSPENLVGSSRGIPIDIPRSSPGSTRPPIEYEHRSLSPHKALALLGRPDENSSDANHMSDDDYEYKNVSDRPIHDHLSDAPGPSTSRPRTDDPQQPPNYLGWPYPPDTSGTSEDSYSALENTNQGWILCERWLASTGLWGGSGQCDGGRTNGNTRNSDEKAEEESNNAVGSGSNATTHTCSKCGRSYTLRSNLSRHMRLECGVERRYSCPHCQKKFSHAHHLRSHERSIHAPVSATASTTKSSSSS